MKWICGSNKPYFNNMKLFMESLERHIAPQAELWYVGVGFQPPDFSPNFHTASLTQEQNYGAPSETECIQHGSFLSVIDGPDDEVLIYSDGDMRVQRPMTEPELDFLHRFPPMSIYAGWNGGPRETMLHEACRLKPKVDPWELMAAWGVEIAQVPILNVGAIAARRSTWRRLYQGYVEKWEEVGEVFSHQARQQWLMCYTIFAHNIAVFTMPPTFHSHGHFGIPPGIHMQDGLVCHQGVPILLRHKL